jgi:hypothetical protein
MPRKMASHDGAVVEQRGITVWIVNADETNDPQKGILLVALGGRMADLGHQQAN